MKTENIRNKTKVDTFFKTTTDYNIDDKKVSFSFEYFRGESVKNTRIGYNSHYQNIESSRNAVGDFFNVIREMSKYTLGELKMLMKKKNQLRVGAITTKEHTERIENILIDDYGFPRDKVEEFDQQYYEFQISDGKRVIWYLVDNMICPLFIDCNHMVCIDSSKNVKAKMKYNEKSSFCKLTEKDLSKEDAEITESIKYIISECENGEQIDKEDIIDLLKGIINY